VNVDCAQSGQTLQAAVNTQSVGALIVNVAGTCIENVTVARDNVRIQRSGATATLTGANNNNPVIALDGARYFVVTGVTITGGSFGLSATRGAMGALTGCDVSGATNTGAIASYGSTLEIDNCVIHDNNRGATGANDASLIVTNSTIRNNANEGLLAIRTSYLRVGQDRGGSAVARPVTVNNNGTHGISVADSSSANIVAANIHHNTSNGILIERVSSALIGVGSNNLVSANTIANNTSSGIGLLEASAAVVQGNTINANGSAGLNISASGGTIIGNTIQANNVRGINVTESGSVRIGVTEGGAQSGNMIINNSSDGIAVTNGSNVTLAGNTVRANTGSGLAVGRATARLIAGNNFDGNGGNGISMDQSRLFQGIGGFTGVPAAADIAQNNAGAGLFLTNTASSDLGRMTFASNGFQGIRADFNSTVLLSVYDPSQPSNLISITNNGIPNSSDGIALFTASMLLSRQKPNPSDPGQIIINGHQGWGVNCLATTNKAAASLDTTGIASNTAGAVQCGGF